jgi:hypothetical protein
LIKIIVKRNQDREKRDQEENKDQNIKFTHDRTKKVKQIPEIASPIIRKVF